MFINVHMLFYDRCDDRPTPPDGRRGRAVHWNPWSPPEGFADRSRSPPTATVWSIYPGGASHGNGNPCGPAPWASVPAVAPAKTLEPPFG